MLRKTIFSIIIITILFIVGVSALLRSCLSKYDERAIISVPLVFEKNGKLIIFSLVKFDKTTSYSQHGGFVNKSVSTRYFLQLNDGITAVPLKEEKLKDHGDIKTFPIEIIGNSSGKAWLFAGEPMAFDPFTLQKMADIAILEQKNPSLTGKFSRERKYYELDRLNGILAVTLKDGTKYRINTTTLLASPFNENEQTTDFLKSREVALQKALRVIESASAIVFQQYRDDNEQYRQRPSADKNYTAIAKRFEKQRKGLDKSRDSIYALQRLLREEKTNQQLSENRLRSLISRSLSFSSIQVSEDTFAGEWYGLYPLEKINDIPEEFDYRSTHAAETRNQLFKTSIQMADSNNRFSSLKIGEEKLAVGNKLYLQGGFLFNRENALPIHLQGPAGFIIVYKEELGNQSTVLIARVDTNGKQYWSMNTGLKDLAYWSVNADRFIVAGLDNKALSSGECNVLHTVDLKTGIFSTYDFFENKMRNK